MATSVGYRGQLAGTRASGLEQGVSRARTTRATAAFTGRQAVEGGVQARHILSGQALIIVLAEGE
jgi:hypothetical protein